MLPLSFNVAETKYRTLLEEVAEKVLGVDVVRPYVPRCDRQTAFGTVQCCANHDTEGFSLVTPEYSIRIT